MTGRASKLDIEKLRKVRALMEGGKTEGERQAARAKAEALAARAGLTLQAALSKMDTPTKPQSGNMFAGFDDWMEAKEPGWKAEQARRRADREAKRLARCRELLAEYGSEKAVFAPNDLERRLRRALAPLRDKWHGMDGFKDWVSGNPTPAMWEAIRKAGPLPDTLQGVWDEFKGWERLGDDRVTFDPYYDMPAHVRAREAALSHLLDRMPAPNVEGVRTRLDWLAHVTALDYARNPEDDTALVEVLRADFAAIAAGMQPAPQDEPQRPAQRRAAVMDLLSASPGLSDREIARRVGCSPQTVGNIRRRAAA